MGHSDLSDMITLLEGIGFVVNGKEALGQKVPVGGLNPGCHSPVRPLTGGLMNGGTDAEL